MSALWWAAHWTRFMPDCDGFIGWQTKEYSVVGCFVWINRATSEYVYCPAGQGNERYTFSWINEHPEVLVKLEGVSSIDEAKQVAEVIYRMEHAV